MLACCSVVPRLWGTSRDPQTGKWSLESWRNRSPGSQVRQGLYARSTVRPIRTKFRAYTGARRRRKEAAGGVKLVVDDEKSRCSSW